MMKLIDFCYMRQGKYIRDLPEHECNLLNPIYRYNTQKDSALLLLHGFGSSPAVYRELIPLISDYDAIVCPVLPGHSESIQAFAQCKAQDWLSTAEYACESLIQEYSQVDVLGLSLGGLLAYQLSHRFPINHLYLLAPALALHLNLGATLMLAHGLKRLGLKQIKNRAGNILSSNQELTYRLLPINTIIEMLNLVKNTQFKTPPCPTDVFLGRFDAVVNSTKVATLFDNTPHITTHWLEQSAHVLPLDRDLAMIAKYFKVSSRP